MAFFCELVLILACLLGTAVGDGEVVEITDADAHRLREGEWMIKFYAPWCPACQQFTAPWISLGRKLKASHPNINIAKVDVSAQPILGGRFMIQQLPTLYHAKAGDFRRYDGGRTAKDVEEYLESEHWQKVEPIPWYITPMGPVAGMLGYAMVGGNEIQKLYNVLTNKHGMPAWLVIACGAVSVITAGVLVGLVMVCCISMVSGSSQSEKVVYPRDDFGSSGDNDEPDRKKDGKKSPQASPKASPAATAAKSSPSTSSPRERKGKGKKMKASTG